MYQIVTSDKVPICSFCELTKATEQINRTERVLSKSNDALSSIGRLAAALCTRQNHDTLLTTSELNKQASNNNEKPAPAEDCYFNHTHAEQMAAPHNRNIYNVKKEE